MEHYMYIRTRVTLSLRMDNIGHTWQTIPACGVLINNFISNDSLVFYSIHVYGKPH